MLIAIAEPIEEDAEAIGSAFKMFWPGIEIEKIESGQDVSVVIGKKLPDFVILDLAFSDADSFEIIKEFRLFSWVPLVVIDSCYKESSLIRAFELGVDDYVVRPLHPIELVIRAKTIMRRLQGGAQIQYVIAGILKLDASLHMVYCGDREVRLTRTENIILRHLMENANNTVTHSSLAQRVWGDDSTDASAALRVYIKRIREKLGDDSKNPSLILAESGIGYRLAS